MKKEDANVKMGGTIALLKAQASQTFEYCAREASQIFGGLAYLPFLLLFPSYFDVCRYSRGGQGEKVERLYREVRAYAIPAGSEEVSIFLFLFLFLLYFFDLSTDYVGLRCKTGNEIC